MTASPTVKVVFAGDSASLEAANKRVIASSETVSHRLKDVSSSAKSMKTTMRGAGDAAQIFGGQLGATAVTAGYALASVKDLTKGVAGLTVGLGAAGAAVVGVAGVVGFLTLDWLKNAEGIQTWGEFGKDATAGLATGLAAVTSWIPGLSSGTADLAAKANNWADANNNVAASYHNIFLQASLAAQFGGTTDDPDGAFTSAASLQPGTVAMQRLQNDADTIAARSARSSSRSGSVGGSVKSAANSVAQAAKEAATKLKQARASVASAVGGIVSALAGHLEAGDPGASLLVGGKLLSASNGTSLIDKLRKQAADTKHFADDLKKLAKLGLDKGLLSDLVAGGLGSLGAADELLRGGRGDIKTANSLNASITASGTGIASAEVTRNLTKKDLGTIKIDLTGAESDVKKMFRKWLRTDGANSFGLAAA